MPGRNQPATSGRIGAENAINHNGFITTTKKGPVAAMVPVEPLRVKTIYVAHDTGQITLRGPKTKMVVLCEAPHYVKLSSPHF